MTNDQRYDVQTIVYHWAVAILVAGLWVVGQTADWFPRGPWRHGYWSIHFAVGLLLIVVLALRIGWRFTGGRKLPDANTGFMRIAAKSGHHLLYLLLVVACALGVANAFVRGVDVFGLFAFPKLIDASFKGPISELHEWSANILILIAVGHAAAALYHQFVVKDGVLMRMSMRA